MFTMMYEDLARSRMREQASEGRHGVQRSSLRIGTEVRRRRDRRHRR